MLRRDFNLSSESDSDDDNFNGHFKKVNYQGNLSDSEHSGEDSGSEDSHRGESKPGVDKVKTIKKNCESAKMSRQRKKVYL